MKQILLIASFMVLPLCAFAQDDVAAKVNANAVHAMSLHGDVKYGADFSHFDYTNPDAPKGGTLRMHAVGTFDTLNPFILKGVAAAPVSLTYETLTEQSDDEPFSAYGLLAESMELAEDNSFIRFNLRKEARFHDGKPVSPDDVVWSFETLREKGQPGYRAYYNDVERVEKTGDAQVTFFFKTTENKELPLIIGQLPVLAKHYWTQEGRDFTETTLESFPGSGPYMVSDVDPGKSLTLTRNKEYWGADLPVNRGRYNFDVITMDYYRDATVAVEALFADEYDFRQENIAKSWATAYDKAQAVKDGRIKKEVIDHSRPAGMQAFVMNVRKPVFDDVAVRRAVNYAFDYEWSNRQFAFDSYTRTNSFFENSELASSGVPEGAELALLEPYREQLPESLFEEPFVLPETDGSGNNRTQLREAIRILEEAGYKTGPDGIRLDPESGERLSFEILENQPAFERWTLPFIKNLKKIGIEASFRLVDTAQYQNRITDFDYDMTVLVIPQSLSPGNEQREFWHSSKADVSGSRNYIGIKDEVVDALVEKVISAPDREALVNATRALDRVLLWQYYVVPQWHLNAYRLAYWDRFGQPETKAPYDLNLIDTWWAKQP